MRTRFRRFGSILAGTLRATAAGTVMLGLAFTQLVRSAEARAGEALQSFGAELLRWEGARPHSTARTLNVNGIELQLVTVSTTRSVREALDHVASLCRSRGGVDPSRGLDETSWKREADARSGLEDGVFRQASEDEGVLACIDTGGPLELEDLAGRLTNFAKDGDLHALGELRYVVARRSARTTALLFLWTEGPAPILRAFPSDRDAPGFDPEGVPRPAETRRVLSATEAAEPYSLNVYESAKDPSAARADYETGLRERGWAVSSPSKEDAFLARRGARTLLVRTALARSGRTLITLAVLS